MASPLVRGALVLAHRALPARIKRLLSWGHLPLPIMTAIASAFCAIIDRGGRRGRRECQTVLRIVQAVGKTRVVFEFRPKVVSHLPHA